MTKSSQLAALPSLVALVVIAGWTGATQVRSGLTGVDLSLEEIADSQGYFVYRYSLSNPRSSIWGMTKVEIDIPADSGTTELLPVTGALLDARQPGGLSHAEVGPITPTGWTAALPARRAELWWFPPTTGFSSEDSISPGEVRTGFGVRSSYFPGISSIRAQPTPESCCLVLDAMSDFYPSPGGFTVSAAAIVPRYTAQMVNIDLLRRQLESVCVELGWIDDEMLCQRLHDHFTNLALDDVLLTLEQQRSPNGPVSGNAYWLLRINAEVLRESLAR